MSSSLDSRLRGNDERLAWLEGVRAHYIHMKRKSLVLDEQLLEEALKLSGQRTYSGTVQLALGELVRRARAGRILDLGGSGLWEGELGNMRRDRGGAKRVPRPRTAR